MDNWQTLHEYRERIDRIDGQVLSLLSERQHAAVSIGKVKRQLGIEVFDGVREKEILKSLSAKSNVFLSASVIRRIFSEILSASRSVQGPLGVAFLGPEASFSHEAGLSLFGRSAQYQTAETVDGVFDLVEKGSCQKGIVPVENSCEGTVGRTLDLLFEHNLKITGELFLRIRHNLLGRGRSLHEVKRICSHPMGLAQCRLWLREHLPGVPIEESKSTSTAAQEAIREPHTAAVGSRLAASHFALEVMAENIEDHPNNVTRFLTIGKKDSGPTGQDKTSLLFSLPHTPGALHSALTPFAESKINVCRIESRPMKPRNWEYLFFVDLEGHQTTSRISKAIANMERHCAFLKRLGSYPSGRMPWD